MKASALFDPHSASLLSFAGTGDVPLHVQAKLARILLMTFGVLGVVFPTCKSLAQSCCGVPMYIEFQEVSTNRIKTGQQGFGAWPPTYYRHYRMEEIEAL